MPVRSRLLAATPLLAMTSLAACTVGPDYKAPEPRLASQWVGPASAGETAEDGWWKTLNDPLLDALVDETLAASPTLREAQARLAEARAARDAVRGTTGPQAQVSASGGETVLSRNGQLPIGSIPGFSRDFSLFDLGFDASWEIDLWGRRTRQIEAANARADQAELAVQGVRLQLIAELARAYVDLRLAQQQQVLARQALDARAMLADLTALRAQAGEAGRSEAEQAASDVGAAQATLAAAQAAERAAALRVVVLAGAQPEALLPRLAAPAPIPAAPVAIQAGLPTDLLRRRPDIRAAERDLAAATADVGVATADLFPRLTLACRSGSRRARSAICSRAIRHGCRPAPACPGRSSRAARRGPASAPPVRASTRQRRATTPRSLARWRTVKRRSTASTGCWRRSQRPKARWRAIRRCWLWPSSAMLPARTIV